jgi:hypothetical protein
MALLASLVRKGNYFSDHPVTFYCVRVANVARSGERPTAVKVDRLRRRTDVTSATRIEISVSTTSKLRTGKSRNRYSILDRGKKLFLQQCPHHIWGSLDGTGAKMSGGVKLTIHLHLVGRLRMCTANHHSPHTSSWPAA